MEWKNPYKLVIYFRPFIGAPCHSTYNDRRGPPCSHPVFTRFGSWMLRSPQKQESPANNGGRYVGVFPLDTGLLFTSQVGLAGLDDHRYAVWRHWLAGFWCHKDVFRTWRKLIEVRVPKSTCDSHDLLCILICYENIWYDTMFFDFGMFP